MRQLLSPACRAAALCMLLLCCLELSGGSRSNASANQAPGGALFSVPMTERELAGAVGGKPSYCNKALISCFDGCGNWGWLGGYFVSACNSGCYFAYSQCGS